MNCNYIKNYLIKNINERFFRDYQIEMENIKDYFPVNGNTSTNKLLIIKEYLHDGEFSSEIDDLINILDGINSDYYSFLASDLEDIKDIMIFKILKNIANVSDTTAEVMSILIELSKESYIVGGFNRDCLLGNESKDIDFVTDICIDHLNEIFIKYGFKTKSVGEHFLVTIVEKEGEHFEIANFRKDKDNTGGEIGNIFEDAQRRDFTCNALYFNLYDSTIVDPNGTSIDDIQNKVLKFIGNPEERLFEDLCRAYRFYRFIGSKGLAPDKRSLKAVRKNFKHAQANVTPERAMNEIERIINLKED